MDPTRESMMPPMATPAMTAFSRSIRYVGRTRMGSVSAAWVCMYMPMATDGRPTGIMMRAPTMHPISAVIGVAAEKMACT